MDCNTSGFPVLHYLLEFTQIHSHWVSIVSNHLIFCHHFSFCLQSFPASGSFPMTDSTSSGQRIGASVSASVLPMNIQGWFPLGLIGLISCCPRDSQESSPALQFKSISSWELSLLYGPTLTPIHDYWKNVALTIQTFVGKVLSLVFSLLSKFVIAFLPRSKCLLISWLQSNSWKCNTWLLWLGMIELQYTAARTIVLSYLSMSWVSLWLLRAFYGPYFQIFCLSQSGLLTLLLKAELSHTSFTTPTWPYYQNSHVCTSPRPAPLPPTHTMPAHGSLPHCLWGGVQRFHTASLSNQDRS